MVAKRKQVFASLTLKVSKILILQEKKDTMLARKSLELSDILQWTLTDCHMQLQSPLQM